MSGLEKPLRKRKRERRHKLRWDTWGAAALLAAGLLSAWTVQAVWPSNDLAPGYMVAQVTRGDIEDTVLATGTLHASELVNVGAQVSGELKVLHVGLGARVRKGQLIAEIDASTQQNALKQAEAREAAARAQVRAKESVWHQHQLTFQRQQGMYKHGATTREAYEAAQAAVAMSRAELDALKAVLQEARVALDTARVNLKYTKIESPIDGVVVAVVAKQGQTLNASVSVPTIVKVAQVDTMRIRAAISEADVVRVSPGQAASFTILGEPGRPREATLKAVELAPESIQTETGGEAHAGAGSSASAVYYSGLLEAPNGDGQLRIGMTVQVRIVLGKANGVLMVPSAALRDKDAMGRRSIMVRNSAGRLQEQWITVGIDDRTHSHVLAGLNEGDQVVMGERASSGAKQAQDSAGS
jgi:macrolide-specific efflux system membrane fusion protein